MPWDDLDGELAELFAQDDHAYDLAIDTHVRFKRARQVAYQAAYVARMPVEERRAMWREKYHRYVAKPGKRKIVNSDARRTANREHMRRVRAEAKLEQRRAA